MDHYYRKKLIFIILKLSFFIGLNSSIFRHFIDLIIRLAYIKNNCQTANMNKILERCIEYNLAKIVKQDNKVFYIASLKKFYFFEKDYYILEFMN